jgi:hypothetical protein
MANCLFGFSSSDLERPGSIATFTSAEAFADVCPD